MVTEDRKTIALLEGAQWDFVMSEARYPGLFAGRGYGKTFSFLTKAFRYVNQFPGADGLLTAPSVAQVNNVLIRQAKRHFGDSYGEHRDWVYYEKKGVIEFPRLKSTIFVRPASEPDSVRGLDLAFAGMDEVARGDDQWETFETLQLAIRQPGYPNQLFLTSTPSDLRPWIRDIYRDGLWPPDQTELIDPENYPIFRGGTMDNPHLDEYTRTTLVRQWGRTRMARQELYGEFLSVSGLVYQNFDTEIHVKDPPKDTVFLRNRAGLDLGVSSPTSLHVLKLDTRGKIWVTDEYYKRNAEVEDWMKWLREKNVTMVVCDPSIPEDDRVYLSRVYGVNLRRAPTRKFRPRYDFWAMNLAIGADGEPGIYISPTCQALIDEIPNLALDERQKGDLSIERWAPGSKDHAFDSSAYAGMTFNRLLQAPIVEVEYSSFD